MHFDSYQTSINAYSGTSQKQISGWGICCVWNGVNDCVSPAVNCFDEIIVTPKNTEVLSAFKKFDSIAQLPDNSKQITAFFLSDESKKLFPDLFEKYPEYVYELSNGNNYIYRKKVGNKNYYIVRKNNDNSDNFVLQIKRLGNGNT